MTEQAVTINHHSMGVLTPGGWRQVLNHTGACTVETCGRHLDRLNKPGVSRRIIDDAIEAVRRVGGLTARTV